MAYPCNSSVLSLSYNVSKQSAAQTITAASTPIVFASAVTSIGSKITVASSGLITLQGGGIYEIDASCGGISSSGTWFYYQVYDVSAAAYIGNYGGGDTVNSTSATLEGSCNAIIDLTSISSSSSKTYYVQSQSIEASTTIGYSSRYGRLHIKELPTRQCS